MSSTLYHKYRAKVAVCSDDTHFSVMEPTLDPRRRRSPSSYARTTTSLILSFLYATFYIMPKSSLCVSQAISFSHTVYSSASSDSDPPTPTDLADAGV